MTRTTCLSLDDGRPDSRGAGTSSGPEPVGRPSLAAQAARSGQDSPEAHETVDDDGDDGQTHKRPENETARRYRRAQRISRALRLRADGLGFAAIGRRLGVSTSTAHAYVAEGLAAPRLRRRSRSPARAAAHRKRRATALRLRIAGCSLREVGDHLGTDASEACRLVKEALAAPVAEAAHEIRVLAQERYFRVTGELLRRIKEPGQVLQSVDGILAAGDALLRVLGSSQR
jgi:DNA-binding transcriptional MerR regulator